MQNNIIEITNEYLTKANKNNYQNDSKIDNPHKFYYFNIDDIEDGSK